MTLRKHKNNNISELSKPKKNNGNGFPILDSSTFEQTGDLYSQFSGITPSLVAFLQTLSSIL